MQLNLELVKDLWPDDSVGCLSPRVSQGEISDVSFKPADTKVEAVMRGIMK